MKKISLLLTSAISILSILTGCNLNAKTDKGEEDITVTATTTTTAITASDENTAIAQSESEIRYITSSSDWMMYENAKNLVDSADIVLSGKVTGISFQVVDKLTGLPPEEGAKKRYNDERGYEVEDWRVFELITLYDIDVSKTYKGNEIKHTQIRAWGGIKDKYIDEQLKATNEYNIDFIMIDDEPIELEVDETYLFVLRQFEKIPPCLINPKQAVYNLGDSALKNDDEYKKITAKDIISVLNNNE